MKYFRRDEIVIHNTIFDIWVIINGNVFDLSKLMKDRHDSDTVNENVKFLLQYAGKDLSVYFEANGSPKMRYTSTGQRVPVFPPAFELATSELAGNTKDCWWWEDPLYKIGAVTKQDRKVRIINTLTLTIRTMRVCEEDTIRDIQAKYERYNSHFGSYLWKKFGPSNKANGTLAMDKTLTENGMVYSQYDPAAAIWLYFTDDFTVG